MTAAADLQTALGSRRRLMFRIEGLADELWQDDGTGTAPAGRSRTGYCCLLPPQEASQEFDLAEMKAGLSAHTFEILDIKDTDGTSRYGKIWGGTARWEMEPHWRIAAGTASVKQVDADATNIPAKYAAASGSAGTIYIHRERIDYANITDDTFVGCTRGTYPVIGDGMGHTISRPLEGTADFIPVIGSVPFSHVGTRVALYVCTQDSTTGTWRPEADDLLLWTGRVSHSIKYVPSKCVWQITAESILQELESKVCNVLPVLTLGSMPGEQLINLTGNVGRTFCYTDYDTDNDFIAAWSVEVRPGIYNIYDLLYELNRGLVNKTLLSGSSSSATAAQLSFINGGDEVRFELRLHLGEGVGNRHITIYGAAAPKNSPDKFCHALFAMGFSILDGSPIKIDVTDGGAQRDYYIRPPNTAFAYYHPLFSGANDGSIYLRKSDYGKFSQQQSGDGFFVRIKDAKDADQYGPRPPFCYYANVTSEATGTDAISGIEYYRMALGSYLQEDIPTLGYVGFRAGEDPIAIEQVCIPVCEPMAGGYRGPFELLVPWITSTGTPGINGDYDLYPYGWGLGIPRQFVDEASFVAADAGLDKVVAQRKLYPIAKPTSLMDIIGRECKLFQKGIVWKNGKISIVPIGAPDPNSWTVQLDESNRYDRHDRPEEDIATSIVVNQSTLKTRNHILDKDWPTITISDADSIDQLGEARGTDLEHPGIWVKDATVPPLIAEWIKGARSAYLRRPSPVLEVSLSPVLPRRIWVGDVVRFVSTCTHDPFGSGSLSTDCYAIVLRVGWDYATWKGTAQILLVPTMANMMPWAPAALVDMTMGGNGYHPPNLYLVARHFGSAGDDDDGARFLAGHVIVVRDTCPSNVNAPTQWGPMTLTAGYDNVGKKLSLPSALTGYNVQKEYYVTAANWADCPSNQREVGTWQANTETAKFSDSSLAYRWL